MMKYNVNIVLKVTEILVWAMVRDAGAAVDQAAYIGLTAYQVNPLPVPPATLPPRASDTREDNSDLYSNLDLDLDMATNISKLEKSAYTNITENGNQEEEKYKHILPPTKTRDNDEKDEDRVGKGNSRECSDGNAVTKFSKKQEEEEEEESFLDNIMKEENIYPLLIASSAALIYVIMLIVATMVICCWCCKKCRNSCQYDVESQRQEQDD
jgi:hypothetical protein